MKLYNSLSKQIEQFNSTGNTLSIYSCGPTVYDNLHIGNLSAFIYADTLRRVLASAYPENTVTHVMNVTDVDDKTIKSSKGEDPDAMQALIKFTRRYEEIFLNDMASVGNDLSAMTFIRATESIEEMLTIIRELHKSGVAYIADDGVYFSIAKYKEAGKTYGQLVHIDDSSTSESRIQNDEYDKESAHDFALWKIAKPGEPSWEFDLDGVRLDGRPGWHIECSAMSRKLLGQPFDIHTGGIDLKFPHHENEIAQSTACTEDPTMARFFVHNEHVLVDGSKMSKSLGNFYTLRDVEQKGFDPLTFRMLVLQGHYRSAVQFSWDNLSAAQNRLNNWRDIACLRWQANAQQTTDAGEEDIIAKIQGELENDLNTARCLADIDEAFDSIGDMLDAERINELVKLLTYVDQVLGLQLLAHTPDISDTARELIARRAEARKSKNWAESDSLRDELRDMGLEIRDTPLGQIWSIYAR